MTKIERKSATWISAFVGVIPRKPDLRPDYYSALACAKKAAEMNDDTVIYEYLCEQDEDKAKVLVTKLKGL